MRAGCKSTKVEQRRLDTLGLCRDKFGQNHCLTCEGSSQRRLDRDGVPIAGKELRYDLAVRRRCKLNVCIVLQEGACIVVPAH